MGGTKNHDLAHPHDLLVQSVLADTDLAADLLKSYLPPEWGTALEWDSLKRESGEAVDESLSKLMGDLRYSARFKGSGEELDVFVVFEHQSKPDWLMSFRILDYVFAAYRRQASSLKKGMRFPYPLAVVLYHGKAPWKEIPPMRDLIAAPEGMASDILNFPIHLIDLAAMPVEGLRGHPMVCALLDSLQSASAGVLPARLQKIIDRLRGLGGEKRIKAWSEALSTYFYALAQGEVKDASDILMRALTGLHSRKEARNMVMTVAEKLQREGRIEGMAAGMAKGKAEGKAEGKIESTLTFLEIRFGAVPSALQKKLRNVEDNGLIEKMLKLAATCQSLKDFQKTL